MLTIVKTEDNTQKILDETELAIYRALEQIGGKAQDYATQLCPVGTPESTGIKGYIGSTLKNSITFVTMMSDGKTVEVEKGEADPFAPNHGGKEKDVKTSEPNTLILGTNVFYAPYVELGTSKMKPRPFLKPALSNHLNEYKHIMANELKKVGK